MKQLEKFTKRFAGLFLPTILFAIACLTGCEKEPEFPAPGIDMSGNQEIVISSDTATTYTMKMKVSTPAGLQVLTVMNANDNTVIEDLSEKYRKQTEFVFEYEVKLPEADTILKYNIQIVDAKSKVINQPFTITVKVGLIPTIDVVGGTTKAVISPMFVLKAKMSSGKKAIGKYELVYDEIKELDKKTFDTPVNSHNFEFFCEMKDLKVGEARKFTLSTFDVDNKKTSVDIMVTLTAGNNPIRVVYEKLNDEQTLQRSYLMYFIYNDNNLVSSIKENELDNGDEVLNRTIDFTYNDKNMVTELKFAFDAEWFNTYKYKYDSEGKFIEATRHDETDATDPDAKVTVAERDAKGNPISILRGTENKLENIKYETFGEETLFIDYIDIATAVTDPTRKHFVGKTAAMWPTYTSALPPFFPESIEKHFLNIFCYKYIYTDRVSTNGMGTAAPKDTPLAKYTYKTDNQDRVTEVLIEARKYTNPARVDFYEVYKFEYAN